MADNFWAEKSPFPNHHGLATDDLFGNEFSSGGIDMGNDNNNNKNQGGGSIKNFANSIQSGMKSFGGQMQSGVPGAQNQSASNPVFNQQQQMFLQQQQQQLQRGLQSGLYDDNQKEQMIKLRNNVIQQQQQMMQQQQQQRGNDNIGNGGHFNSEGSQDIEMGMQQRQNSQSDSFVGTPPVGQTPRMQPGPSIGNPSAARQMNSSALHGQKPFAGQLQDQQVRQQQHQLPQQQPHQMTQQQQQKPPPPQQHQQSQQQQSQPSQQPRLSNMQMAQLQSELFLATLQDFLNRKGTPITQTPVINSKRVNLFYVYMISSKLGGPQELTKALQQPVPGPQNPWTILSSRLGLLENVHDDMQRTQVEKELARLYLDTILPYLQYCNTPNGQRDMQQRRAYFHRQILLKFQSQAQQQQQPQPTQQKSSSQSQQLSQNQSQQLQQQQRVNKPMDMPTSAVLPTNKSLNDLSNIGMSPGVVAQSPAPNFVNSPSVSHQSPHLSSAATPQQRRMSRASNQSTQNSPYLNQQPAPQSVPTQRTSQQGTPLQQFSFGPAQQQGQNPVQRQIPPPRSSSVASQTSFTTPSNGPIRSRKASRVQTPMSAYGDRSQGDTIVGEQDVQSKQPSQANIHTSQDPNIIKKYVPFKKPLDLWGGYEINRISSIGGELDGTKPVFLFAPELGTINIHALTMSLKSYSSPNSNEAMYALNTLLVATSDAMYGFKIDDCKELLDSLAKLGLKILEHIVDKDSRYRDPYNEVSDLPSNDAIDSVFEKYVKKNQACEDIAFVVESLTGEVIEDEMDDSEDSDEFMDDIFSPQTDNAPILGQGDVDSFSVPDYLTSLMGFKEENKNPFSKLQSKSATDEQLMLVDSLITVTMIIRNISFGLGNQATLAKNPCHKKLFFSIVKTIATNPNNFIFYRKRLCLMKDCLVILNNLALNFELETLEETFLVVALVFYFGPKVENSLRVPKTKLDVHTYFQFAIDSLAKLLVKEPYNRTLFSAILTGSLNVSGQPLIGNAKPLRITDEDRLTTEKLINAYMASDSTVVGEGGLIIRMLQILFSILPFDATTFEFSKFVFSRAPVICQALFSAKLILDMLPLDEFATPYNRLVVEWLVANKEPLLTDFVRMAVILTSETDKVPQGTEERRVLNIVLIKAMVAMNTLLGHAISYQRMLEESKSGVDNSNDELLDRIKSLSHLTRLVPERHLTIDITLSASVDGVLSTEVTRMLRLIRRLGGQTLHA